MTREFRINVQEGGSVEETAEWLALWASAVLHELFLARQWREAMALMAQKVTRIVAEDGAVQGD